MKGKILAILLSLCLVITLLPIGALASASDFSDMPAKSHWSYEALSSAVENGLLEGYNGTLTPQSELSRAQLAAIVNRAFGAQATADLSGYTDLSTSKWYYNDMAKAVRMGTFMGSGGTLRPEDSVTRQEAFTVLARSLKLTAGSSAALDGFTDKTEVASWAEASVAAMVSEGYVEGAGGKLNPTQTITREEFAQVIYKMFSVYISEPGTYTTSITGNVLIRSANVTLKGLTVTGDLILGEGIGNGDVSLDGVTVTKRLVVRAGGENSIHIINNSGIGSIVIGKTGDGGVRVRTEEGCRVDVVYVDDGTDDIILEGSYNQVTVATDSPVLLKDAKVTGLTVSGKGADVKLEGSTTVSDTQISSSAAGAKFEVGTGSKAASVQSAAEGVTISGTGTVTQAIITGNNTAVNTTGTTVTAGENTTGVTQNGKEVGSTTTGGSTGGYWNAVSVTTFDGLEAALAKSSVSEIIINAEIEIAEADTLTFNKPVTIAKKSDTMLVVNGTLINNSTLTSKGLGGDNVDTGMLLDGNFENNGTFINESRFGMFEGSIINNGTVNNKSWLHCFGTEITNNKTFNNTGDITLINSSAVDVAYNSPSTFTNAAGATLLSEDPGGLIMQIDCAFTNAGTATFTGYFDNYGTLTNTGSFTYTGHLMTAGPVTGTLTKGTGGELETNYPVSTLAALKTALTSLSAGYDGIAIVGNIMLDDDLLVSRHVRIGPDGVLTVPDGYTLTVTSTSGYNGLDVLGTLDLYGNLVTTLSGSGDDECVGQVTLIYGTLSAHDDYTITNDGVILFIGGEIYPDDIVVSGNPINNFVSLLSVSDETALRSALANDNVEQIIISDDISLSSNLDITKEVTVGYNDTASSPYTLTVANGTTLTVKDGGSLDNTGCIVNNGTVQNTSSGNGIFMGSLASFTNNGTLNVDKMFFILEGTLTNNGLITVSSGDEHTILCRGASVTNSSGAVFNDNGSLDMDVSTGFDGALYNRGSTFTNAGDFAVGSISTPASSAYFGARSSSVTNTGAFVNNGNTDFTYTSLTHSGGTFGTYNSGGLTITGGSFTITDTVDEKSFTNNGYMRIIDQYGKSDVDHICTVSLADSSFADNSNWLDYTAAVYSSAGFTAANAAQTDKISALGSGESYFGFATYNRMDFMADITLSGSNVLSDFGTYWVEKYQVWNSTLNQDETITSHLTIASGATLTVARQSSLHVFGVLVNNGTLVTAERYDDEASDIHEDCGYLEIWPTGTFTNNGSITNGGEISLRHEFRDTDNTVQRATATGLSSVTPSFIAIVHNTSDLLAANSSSSPVYSAIEIRGDSLIDLTSNLTVSKSMYIEPGSGFIVEHGAALTFSGTNIWINNQGDVSVYGDMLISAGANFENRQNMDIGAASGSETASVTVGSGGCLYNGGTISVYATGTLDAHAGTYEGASCIGAGTIHYPA